MVGRVLLFLAATQVLPCARPYVPATVLVYDYAGLDATARDQMAATAAEVLGRAGVRTGWAFCNAGQPDACAEQLAPTHFLLRIVRKAPRGRAGLEDAFGVSLNGDGAAYATLFADEVFEIARLVGVPRGRLLGYAAAHEIGHLLLGPDAHSRTGLMRGVWDRADFNAMNCRWLAFRPAEAERLRQEITRRGTVLAAAKTAP